MSTKKLDVVRVLNPNSIEKLKPYFTLPDKNLLDQLVRELSHALRTTPDSVLVLLGMDEDEAIKALLIATNPGHMYSHINVTQLWAHPDTDRSWVDTFMARMIMWAVALNKTYLRGETGRNAEAIYRRFGFEPQQTIVTFDLKKTGLFDLLTKHPEEILSWATFSHQAPPLSLG